jgi:hypothetical protein
MTSENRRSPRAIVAAALTFGTFCITTACTDRTAQSSASPGMTYDSIEQLPDFSGWWQLRMDPTAGIAVFLNQLETFSANLKPEAAEQFNKTRAAIFGSPDASTPPSSLPDPVDLGLNPSYCKPPRFVGDNGGFVEAVEFLFTPGRVTITNESGMIRRVFLNRPLPTDVDESYMGASVGRWDGQTLVVETTGLDHAADALNLLGLKLGRGARTVERFSLTGPDTLEVELTITAPEIYTAPTRAVMVFERLPDYAFQENTYCVDDDRSVDPDTGRQRFDLTPPSDLPPPPR